MKFFMLYDKKNRLSTALWCDMKSYKYLFLKYFINFSNPVFCNRYPTGMCVPSNRGVQSSRDNEARGFTQESEA